MISFDRLAWWRKYELTGLGKVVFGFGLLLLIGGLTAVILLVRSHWTSTPAVVHPKVEVIRKDEKSREIALHDKTTGETTKSGPDSQAAAGGERDATLPPRWVPSYPAAFAQAGGPKRESKGKVTGTYLAKTKDSPDKVKEYFDSTLKADGFETEATSASKDGNDSATVTAKIGSGARKLTVTATTERSVTNLVVTYEEAK